MAKKKTKNYNWILIIFVFVLITGGIFLYSQETALQGITILSIDKPEIKVGETVTEPYLIYARLTGADKIRATLTEDELDARNNIKISVDAVEETSTYSITKLDNEPIIYISYIPVYENTGLAGIPTGTTDSCPDGYWQATGLENNAQALFKRDVRHCFRYVWSGFAGNLNRPTIEHKATFTISNGIGPDITEEFSSKSGTINFKQNGKTIGSVEGVGALVSGNPLPFADKLDVTTPVYFETGKWYFIPEDNWEDIESSYNLVDNLIKTQPPINDIGEEDDYINHYTSLVNNYNDKLYDKVYEEQIISGFSWNDRTSQDECNLKFSSGTTLTQYETFRLILDADWVGIEIASGKPKITDITCPQFNSADQGLMQVSILNDANAEDVQFYIEVKDCSPINQKYADERIYLDEYEEGIANIELTTGTINADISKTCTVRVSDSYNPDNYDEDTVTCKVKKFDICTENSQKISSDSQCVDVCKNGEFTQDFCCDDDEEPRLNSKGVYVCIDKEAEPGEQDQVDFLETIRKNIDNIIIGLSIMISISAYVLLYNKFESKKKKKDNTNLILFGILSIGLGLITWWLLGIIKALLYSWIGIVVIIIVILLLFIPIIKRLILK